MDINRKLDSLCDFDLWHHPWSWACIFKVNFFKKVYLRNGGLIDIERKGMRVDRMLNPACDIELWLWPWAFKVKLWNSLITRMRWTIDMEQKGCESISCWTHYVTLTVNLNHDLGNSRWNFQIAISHEWDGQLTWNKRDASLIWYWTHFVTLDFKYGLVVGYSTYQLHWPSNGLMQTVTVSNLWAH